MKKISIKVLSLALIAALGFGHAAIVRADDEPAVEAPGTSISITPVSNVISLNANSTYDYTFKVTNGGDTDMRFEVYAAPYSYTFDENTDEYALGFSRENSYTQITRWITFKNADGNFVERPVFVAAPGATVEVAYRITTPESIPGGGQYAVLFAHTLSGSTGGSGIKTEASPGLVIYGRAAGETHKKAAISGLTIEKSYTRTKGGQEEVIKHINASAKIKNEGNVDFTALGTLKVENVFFGGGYETESGEAAISVIPETELTLSDEWKETPWFGFFKVTWTVMAAGQTETIERFVVIIPTTVIIVAIIVLTALAFWIIILVRKRKARRSKYLV